MRAISTSRNPWSDSKTVVCASNRNSSRKTTFSGSVSYLVHKNRERRTVTCGLAPTLRDYPIDELTTDQNPDLRFYQTSLDEAVRAGNKTVLVFSTPAFCQTTACGPVLDNAKRVSEVFPNVDFIHVEVYTGLTDPDFVPDAAHLAPAVHAEAWNLQSEPWVFVIDEAGIVTARFEGVMSTDGLTAALG